MFVVVEVGLKRIQKFFARLAAIRYTRFCRAQVSDCDTAKHGGDLGWFAANYMQPEFEAAVLALEVDQLSGIVETASGVHLIQRTG